MAQGPDSLGGDMLIEGSAQCRRVGVEVDPAELGAAIPGGLFTAVGNLPDSICR